MLLNNEMLQDNPDLQVLLEHQVIRDSLEVQVFKVYKAHRDPTVSLGCLEIPVTQEVRERRVL